MRMDLQILSKIVTNLYFNMDIVITVAVFTDELHALAW